MKDPERLAREKPSPQPQAVVVLPCGPEEFREFISGLLGKPQTINKGFRGSFEIQKQDIENLHHLIIQRVTQQNEATLIQFTARIIFDDHSSVLLNSLSDFLHYNEVRPISSTDVHLTWSFLVRFLDRDAPEKQDIEISFLTHTGPPFVFFEEDCVFRPISATCSGPCRPAIPADGGHPFRRKPATRWSKK